MSTPHFANTPAFFNELASGETPSSGQVSLYAKTDGKMYYKDDLGVETEVGGGLTNITETLQTASPNNTVNAEQLAVINGTTNVSLVLTPKGTGAFILGAAPNAAVSGGNVRGANAVDLQSSSDRLAATEVASGQYSAVLGGNRNTASGICATVAGGGRSGSGKAGNNASGVCSFIGGGASNSASGTDSCVMGGYVNSASGEQSSILGGQSNTTSEQYTVASGARASSYRFGMFAHAANGFNGTDVNQKVTLVANTKTTDATPKAMDLRGNATRHINIPSGYVCSYIVQIVGSISTGVDVCRYLRQVTIKNVGGTTSLVGSVITLGSDEEVGTSISITADDINDRLIITVTGKASETWRWSAILEGVEIQIGS